MKRNATIPIALLLCAGAAAAAAREDPARIDGVARAFLERETRGLPGKVTMETGSVDARVSLPACTDLHAFFPPGSNAWGQTSVGVRCSAPSAWTVYVPANVRVFSTYLVAARPLGAGQEIVAADFAVREGELTQLPSGTLTSATQAIGRRTAHGIRAGQPLRRDAVREPPAVVQGQAVALVLVGNGFRVSAEGQALGMAPEGERVQVKTAGGSVVTGIARAGSVVEVMR